MVTVRSYYAQGAVTRGTARDLTAAVSLFDAARDDLVLAVDETGCVYRYTSRGWTPAADWPALAAPDR